MIALIELTALFMALAFSAIQFGMAIASRLWYPKLYAWKTRLQHSHSIRAKLALTIFFS